MTPSSVKTLRVALAGNPNSGKTSIFNNLTGSRRHVANYPGVTVETRTGTRLHRRHKLRVTDLPGTYSLRANSPEEQIAGDHLMGREPDVVVQVIDAANLERSLYLTIQLRELGLRLVLDLNMIDEAEARGIQINQIKLAELLDVEVVATVGNHNRGTEELLEAILRGARRPRHVLQCPYDPRLAAWIEATAQELENADGNALLGSAYGAAIGLLEGNAAIRRRVERDAPGGSAIVAGAARLREELARDDSHSVESLLAEGRYAAAARIAQAAVTRHAAADHKTLSERIDAVLLSRSVGLPIFAALMYAMFQLSFVLGEAPMNWIQAGVAFLDRLARAQLAAGPLRSMLTDGVLNGAGGVLVFFPNVLLLFLGIGLLEKTGYMARAAFLMDRVMHKFGLHGRSFIPMLTGFGCSVPAIMATRTLEHRRDRLATMMVIPLMSCSARLPIYALLIPAFFPLRWRGVVFFSIYLIGILLAVMLVKALRLTLLAGESTPFIMELPPYRMPTPGALVSAMWRRSVMYLRKAGTVILAVSILMWAATSFPRKPVHDVDLSPVAARLSPEQLARGRAAEDLAYSLAGRAGRAMEPVFRPLGFDWRICTALIGAMAAKEVFVAQLGIVNSLGDAGNDPTRLRAALARRYTPLTAFCVMLFCLIAAPCAATVATTAHEAGSRRWAAGQFVGLTVMAYLVTLVVHVVGSLLFSR